MNKFHYYVSKARELNSSIIEETVIAEDEIIDKIDNFDEDESIKYFEENLSKKSEEKISLKSQINLINESKTNDAEKAKQIYKLLIKNNIKDKNMVEKIMRAFDIEAEIKNEVLNLF